MKMLRMLWNNFWGGARTLPFPHRPPVTERFRGLVEFDPERCTGCAVCKFRCTSRAIDFKAGKGEFTWSYNPGQCTFCGRCVEGCKDHALSQECAPPPLYTHQGELKKSYTVARKGTVKPPSAPAKPPTVAATPAISGGTE
jgi:formate hydrogenlyase subunit 6/NADH:ubiquinone oxidoreductase subunit I